MKRLFLISACAILAFSACKKDSNKTTATVSLSATVGGTNETYSNVIAQSIVDTPGYTIGISGSRGSGANLEVLQLEVNSVNPITTGTYTLNSSTSSDISTFPLLAYYKYTSATNELIYGTDLTGANVSTITISSISSTNVQGTFSGVLIDEIDGTTTDAITSGKFNATITKAKQ
jgi:hypothetical protein